MFDSTSRYAVLETGTVTVIGGDGQPRLVAFKRRRFLPATDGEATLVQHTVTQGDRLDNITARYLGDPTQFWRVCDSNHVMRPEELEVPGRIVTIGLPQR